MVLGVFYATLWPWYGLRTFSVRKVRKISKNSAKYLNSTAFGRFGCILSPRAKEKVRGGAQAPQLDI